MDKILTFPLTVSFSVGELVLIPILPSAFIDKAVLSSSSTKLEEPSTVKSPKTLRLLHSTHSSIFKLDKIYTFPLTVSFSVGESVLIPIFPPSLMIKAIVSSSKNLAISALPSWITSNAGPVPSFEMENLSVTLIFVSIALTFPLTVKSPLTSKLLQLNNSDTLILSASMYLRSLQKLANDTLD